MTTRFTCPREHPQFETSPYHGAGWYTCEKRSCRAEWFGVILPSHATGFELARIFGAHAAALLLERLRPEAADLPDPDRWHLRLAGVEDLYLVIPTTGRLRHHHRRSPPEVLLKALAVVA